MSKKFSEFTSAVAIDPADELVGLQAGDNMRTTVGLVLGAITASQINAALGSGALRHAHVQLSAADLIALDGTPIGLVAAPAAGNVLLPVYWTLSYTNGGTNFTTGTGSFLLKWNGVTGFISYFDQTLIEGVSTVSAKLAIDGTSGVSKNTADIDGVALQLETDEPIADGDGTVDIHLWYILQPTAGA